ncbi:eclosion hormone isoform X2 [Choristoneura fumiferana]
MSGKLTACLLFAIFLVNLGYITCNPAIASGFERMDICIENCAQCKKMLGAWFDGPLCGQTCIKMRGHVIPDCENYASIERYINKL